MLRLLVVVLAALSSSVAQNGDPPESPCPAVFRYAYSPTQRWHGIISIVPPLTFSEVQLALRLAVALYRPDSGVGKVEVLGGATEVQNIANRASQSQRQKIQYLVTFPPYQEFPRISSVIINGKEFCSSPVSNDARGVIELKYSLKTGLAVGFASGNEFTVDGGSYVQPQQPIQQQWPQQHQQPTQQQWPQQPQQPTQQQWPQQPQQPTQQQWNQQPQQQHWPQYTTQRPQRPQPTPAPQQPEKPDTIGCVDNDNVHQMTTGRPPNRPKTTSRPRGRPNSTTAPFVFPDDSSSVLPTDSAPEENPQLVGNNINIRINSVVNQGADIKGIEKHLETLVSLVSMLKQDTRNKKGNKKDNGGVDKDDEGEATYDDDGDDGRN